MRLETGPTIATALYLALMLLAWLLG